MAQIERGRSGKLVVASNFSYAFPNTKVIVTVGLSYSDIRYLVMFYSEHGNIQV